LISRPDVGGAKTAPTTDQRQIFDQPSNPQIYIYDKHLFSKKRSAVVLSFVLRWTRSPLSGRAVKDASLFDGGRGNMFTHRERAWTVDFVHAHDFDYCRAFFGGGSLLCSYSSLCILVLRLGD